MPSSQSTFTTTITMQINLPLSLYVEGFLKQGTSIII